MTVTPSTVMALWSDGPAPPRRLATPAFGSTSLMPWDCSSLIRRSVRGFGSGSDGGGILVAPMGGCLHGKGGAVGEERAQQFGAGGVPDRVHHPLALGY